LAGHQTPLMMQCGREISVDHIKELADLYSNLGRIELARTICEHWGWMTATGKPKEQACMKLLAKLEEQRIVHLPVVRSQRSPSTRVPERTARRAAFGDRGGVGRLEARGAAGDLDKIGVGVLIDGKRVPVAWLTKARRK